MDSRTVLVLLVTTFFGAAHSMPQELLTLLVEYREKCVALSGSDEGHTQIVNSLPSAKDCVLNRVDQKQLVLDSEMLDRGMRKPFFDKYCPRINESVDCYDVVFEGVAICGGEGAERVKDILKDIAHNLVDLGCRNDGQLLFDVTSREFQECMFQTKENITECLLSVLIMDTPISKYGEKQCRELDRSLECVKRTARDCEAPGLVDVVTVVFKTMSQANECQQYSSVDKKTADTGPQDVSNLSRQ